MTEDSHKSKIATFLTILALLSACGTFAGFLGRCQRRNADQRRAEEQRAFGENADEMAKWLGQQKHAERLPQRQEDELGRVDEPDGDTLVGKAVAITDGDTFKLLMGNEEIRVRLEGIDCPEMRGGQPYCNRAKQALSDLIFGKEVSVKSIGTDRYGRTLGRVFVDGLDVNRELVARGLAWHYVEYSDDETLADAERAAREAQRGLWGERDPIAPWQWRNGERPAP